MKRSGGAGIYYHLSYHGDPASWIWLSPLSPAFISTELTKAYTFGAGKIWIFNVGDIKPAEKEISFAMELAWDIEKWGPENAHRYIGDWAERTFGKRYAKRIADIQDQYYRLQASGKDSHVYFLEYSEDDIKERLDRWKSVAFASESFVCDLRQGMRSPGRSLTGNSNVQRVEQLDRYIQQGAPGWHLRGYTANKINLSRTARGRHQLEISFLDPGIVLQEIRVY